MTVTRDNFDDRLLDYLYGELAPAERAAFEAYVTEHPEAQQALNELQTTRAVLSPLAADLEPSQIATNRVLAHARDAAEGMALSGRLWGLFPRYGTAMAALLAVAVGIAVVAPRDAAQQPRPEYQIAKGEDASVRSYNESNEPPALARRSRVQERDVLREAETELRSRRTTAPADELKADRQGGGVARAMDESAGAPEESVAQKLSAGEGGLDAVGDDMAAFGTVSETVVGGRVATHAPADAKAKHRAVAVNRLAYQAAGPTVGQSAVSADGFADTANAELQAPQPQSKVSKTNAYTYAEEAPAATPPRTDAPAVADYRGAGMASDRDANVLSEPKKETVLEHRELTAAGAPEPVSIATQMDAGREHQLQGEYAAAVEYFQNVVAAAPAAPVAVEAQHETGRSLAKLGDCPRAIVAFQDVLDSAPAYPRRDDVLLEQAACLVRVGNVRLAEDRYRMAEVEYPAQLTRVRTERRLNVLEAEGRLKKARKGESETLVAPTKQ